MRYGGPLIFYVFTRTSPNGFFKKSSYGKFYGAVFWRNNSAGESKIFFFHGSLFEKVFERIECVLISCDYHNSGCVPIKPMHDSGTDRRIISDAGNVRKLFQKKISERFSRNRSPSPAPPGPPPP